MQGNDDSSIMTGDGHNRQDFGEVRVPEKSYTDTMTGGVLLLLLGGLNPGKCAEGGKLSHHNVIIYSSQMIMIIVGLEIVGYS